MLRGIILAQAVSGGTLLVHVAGTDSSRLRSSVHTVHGMCQTARSCLGLDKKEAAQLSSADLLEQISERTLLL